MSKADSKAGNAEPLPPLGTRMKSFLKSRMALPTTGQKNAPTPPDNVNDPGAATMASFAADAGVSLSDQDRRGVLAILAKEGVEITHNEALEVLRFQDDPQGINKGINLNDVVIANLAYRYAASKGADEVADAIEKNAYTANSKKLDM